jgi:hypothetical protein
MIAPRMHLVNTPAMLLMPWDFAEYSRACPAIITAERMVVLRAPMMAGDAILVALKCGMSCSVADML